MTTHYSFRLKLERAREHLRSFDGEATAWLATTPFELVDEPDPEPPSHPISATAKRQRIRVSRADAMPVQLNLIIGDCLFNLRSSLDHLAFALARAYTPTMTQRQIKGSGFPVSLGPMMPGDEKNKIGCINPRARAVILTLQPYHQQNGCQTHALWQLHELNRIDKHRTLTACVPVSRTSGEYTLGITNINNWANVDYSLPGGGGPELELDTVLRRDAPVPKDIRQPVLRTWFVAPEITFTKDTVVPLEAVSPTLTAICDYIDQQVISPLEIFL